MFPTLFPDRSVPAVQAGLRRALAVGVAAGLGLVAAPAAAALSVTGEASAALTAPFDPAPGWTLSADALAPIRNLVLGGDAPAWEVTWTFLGSEAGFRNAFRVGGGEAFDSRTSAVGDTFTAIVGAGPLAFAFATLDPAGAQGVANGENAPRGGDRLANFAVLAAPGLLPALPLQVPERWTGRFDAILGFNDRAADADFDDLVVGVRVVPIPEPGEWALMLAGLAVVAGVASRRRRTGERPQACAAGAGSL